MVHTLNTIALITLSMHIILFDIRFHRIQNISLIALMPLLLLSSHTLAFSDAVLLIIVVSTICIVAKIGMGDIKLLALLIAFQGEIIAQPAWLILFSFIALISTIAHAIQRRGLSGDIALAPAILIPFLTIFLGFY